MVKPLDDETKRRWGSGNWIDTSWRDDVEPALRHWLCDDEERIAQARSAIELYVMVREVLRDEPSNAEARLALEELRAVADDLKSRLVFLPSEALSRMATAGIILRRAVAHDHPTLIEAFEALHRSLSLLVTHSLQHLPAGKRGRKRRSARDQLVSELLTTYSLLLPTQRAKVAGGRQRIEGTDFANAVLQALGEPTLSDPQRQARRTRKRGRTE